MQLHAYSLECELVSRSSEGREQGYFDCVLGGGQSTSYTVMVLAFAKASWSERVR